MRMKQNTGGAIARALGGTIALAFAASAAHADALGTPALAGPLTANPNPFGVELGPLGKTYVSGVVTGLAFVQTNALPSDQDTRADLSNAQMFIQKTDGLLQYYVQVGAYALPSLGTGYVTAGDTTDALYGVLPVGYLKLAPSDNFSILGGKLPTLIGLETTFTFQNMNIQRGLLWNQESAVSRGLQANYAAGPIAVSVAWTDGFYSDRYNVVTGSVAWTINKSNVLTFVGGGNVGSTSYSTVTAPLALSNSSIFNLIYSHTGGAWTIQPYLQYTHVNENADIGIAHEASTFGVAVLANYAFNEQWNLAGRVEYLDSSGTVADGSPNLLYGPGSNAWSLTLTPTWQVQRFFVRGELSYVKAGSTTAGFTFGKEGNDDSQFRAMVETGFIF